MTTNELHDILESKNRLAPNEIKDIIYQLKNDCVKVGETDWETGFYCGEVNAFYIALDLLDKLEASNDKN